MMYNDEDWVWSKSGRLGTAGRAARRGRIVGVGVTPERLARGRGWHSGDIVAMGGSYREGNRSAAIQAGLRLGRAMGRKVSATTLGCEFDAAYSRGLGKSLITL